MNLNKVTDGLGRGIDDKIKPLVRSILKLGLEPTLSCEGHKSHGRPYPWVDVHDAQDLSQLIKYISEWNKNSNVKWELRKEYLLFYEPVLGKETFAYRLKPINYNGTYPTLKILRENAKDLSNYLKTKAS
ncbi:MAG: hypothetical protein JSW73_03080 [Candidatus Woesearchaeota archaeon]|nr:MAG: hypothetical protein JSW73_03080 [Candidatus Woesearchaeota archaeon]